MGMRAARKPCTVGTHLRVLQRFLHFRFRSIPKASTKWYGWHYRTKAREYARKSSFGIEERGFDACVAVDGLQWKASGAMLRARSATFPPVSRVDGRPFAKLHGFRASAEHIGAIML